MNREYYAELTQEQAEAYLKRIGMEREAPTKAYLDALVFAHQCSVPFEVLDISEKDLCVSLKVGDLFDKLVTRRRGGYCYEVNGLFVLLLRALGFDAVSAPCRILREDTPYPNAVHHRGNVIRLEGKQYFCDVGCGGPMPPAAVELTEGVRQVMRGETFWVERVDEFWWTLRRMTKGATEIPLGLPKPGDDVVREVPVLRLSTVPWENIDFVDASNASCAPGSSFHRRSVNLRRPNGYLSITENLLTEVADGVRTRREIDEAEFRHIVREVLGLIY